MIYHFEEKGDFLNGLKDHQIQELVNEITNHFKQIKIFCEFQNLRQLIHTPTLKYIVEKK